MRAISFTTIIFLLTCNCFAGLAFDTTNTKKWINTFSIYEGNDQIYYAYECDISGITPVPVVTNSHSSSYCTPLLKGVIKSKFEEFSDGYDISEVFNSKGTWIGAATGFISGLAISAVNKFIAKVTVPVMIGCTIAGTLGGGVTAYATDTRGLYVDEILTVFNDYNSNQFGFNNLEPQEYITGKNAVDLIWGNDRNKNYKFNATDYQLLKETLDTIQVLLANWDVTKSK